MKCISFNCGGEAVGENSFCQRCLDWLDARNEEIQKAVSSYCQRPLAPTPVEVEGQDTCEHVWEWVTQPGTVNGPEEHFKICKECGMEYPGSDA